MIKIAAILSVGLPLLTILSSLYISRGHYRHAELGLANGVYEPMAAHLYDALDALPLGLAPLFCRADLQKIHTGLGRVWYERGRRSVSNAVDQFSNMQTALSHYTRALDLGYRDIEAIRGVAQATAALEFTHQTLFPDRENRFNALPLFMAVSQKDPVNFTSQNEVAHYLYKKRLDAALRVQVTHMMAHAPNSYRRLKKESYYSSHLWDAVQQGLENAIETRVAVPHAHRSISMLFEEKKEYAQAAGHLKIAMGSQRVGYSSATYLRLGRLHLKSGRVDEAHTAYIASLRLNSKKSSKIKKKIHTIFSHYNRHGDLDAFLEFAEIAKKRRLYTRALEFASAKAQIALKRFVQAKKTLRHLNEIHSDPEVYHLLSEVARKEKDWDQMELWIQKATMLEPEKALYLKVLAEALLHQKKYRSAAAYMEKAVNKDPGNDRYQTFLETIQSRIN